MLRAVKEKISSYLSPLSEKRNSAEGLNTSSYSPKRKRPLVDELSDCTDTPGKRIKREVLKLRSPLKLFDKWNWGGIFDKVSKENNTFLNSVPYTLSPPVVKGDKDMNMGSRKILTASRKKQRVPLSQLSSTTILDLTNIDDDDNGGVDVSGDVDDEEPSITKFSIDLTSPPQSQTLVNGCETNNLQGDETRNKSFNKYTYFPTSNMIGPLRREKSRSILHETIRLDEKTRYKSLLAQYTNTHLPEYSKSISPDKQSSVPDTFNDSVSSLSSWFHKGDVEHEPVCIDLTSMDSTQPSLIKTPGSTGRKFFHELLSQSKHSPPFQYTISDSKLPSMLSSSLLPGTPESKESQGSVNSLLDTDWIQKWRDTIDPLSLERERRIEEEEKRKEAIKRKQKEEFEELEKRNKEKAKVSEFIELSSEMKNLVKRALGPGSARDVLVEGFNAEITRADIATLRKSTWLNDEVVNFYFNLIKERGEKTDGLPKVHVFNTFFYPKIMKVGHSGVKRWTRKVDVFSYDLILIPVHLGMHWCMASIDFRTKQIVYYDSLRGNNPSCIVALRQYMNDESKDKKKVDFNFDGWTELMPKQIPEQMNGCDCGVFACKYAEYKSRNADFTFSQANMPYFRERMVYEIISKQLL